jgi:hypothetical protein
MAIIYHSYPHRTTNDDDGDTDTRLREYDIQIVDPRPDETIHLINPAAGRPRRHSNRNGGV